RPSSVINWRRLMSSMGSSPEPAVPAYRRLRMPRKRPQVLGVDLNCSESSWGAAVPVQRIARQVCQDPLHCGISAASLSASGQSRPRKSKPGDHPCPLGPESEGRPSRRDYVAERPLRTLRRRKTFDKVVGPEKKGLGPERT